jgi:hypothetical protein
MERFMAPVCAVALLAQQRTVKRRENVAAGEGSRNFVMDERLSVPEVTTLPLLG